MAASKYARAAHLLRSGLSQLEAADVMGVDPRTLRRWEKDGKLPEPGSNGNGTKKEKLSEARLRKEAALAEKHELDAATRRGELVDRKLLEDVLLRLRSAVDSLPRTLSVDVAELLGITRREALPLVEKVASMVRREVRMELERMAEENATQHEEPEPLPEDAPAFVHLRRADIETMEELRAVEDDLEELDGIGPARARAIREWLG